MLAGRTSAVSKIHSVSKINSGKLVTDFRKGQSTFLNLTKANTVEITPVHHILYLIEPCTVTWSYFIVTGHDFVPRSLSRAPLFDIGIPSPSIATD